MKNGFSLVELSIVLVILGLLTGGILAGQSLIRAAELRSVGTDLTRYSTGVYAFRDRYFALPGDITNAASIWSGTANGDGNGTIDQYSEGFRFWQHLALAGLIEGSYTGTAVTNNAVLGGNIPRSRLGNAGYQIWNEVLSANGWTGSGAGNTSNAFRTGNWALAGGTGGDPSRITSPALGCDESWNLDTKLDDGKPGLGTWLLHYSISSACITATDRATAVYRFTTAGQQALVDFQYLR